MSGGDLPNSEDKFAVGLGRPLGTCGDLGPLPQMTPWQPSALPLLNVSKCLKSKIRLSMFPIETNKMSDLFFARITDF